MALGWLWTAVSDVAAPVIRAAREALTASSTGAVQISETRTHLKVKGVHEPGSEAAAQSLEQRLNELDGVRGAEVNAVLGRVMIDHDSGVPASEWQRVIADAEREHGLAGAAPASVHHPGNPGAVLREVATVGLTLAGLGYVGVTSFVPVRVLPRVVPAVISLTDAVPWMRKAVEVPLGRQLSNVAFGVGSAVAQGLARNSLGLAVDSCQRVCTSREAIARYQAWHRWNEAVAQHHLGTYRTGPLAVPPRPGRLPDGPIEWVVKPAGALGLAGYGTALWATANPSRALATLNAAIPRAAHAGREAFASYLSSSVSERGCLVMRTDVLRRLDRIDTVVLDTQVLLTGRHVVDTITPVDPDADTTALFKRASKIIDPRHPKMPKERGEWFCAPLTSFQGEIPEILRQTAQNETGRGATALLLVHLDEPVALVTVTAELDPLAEAIVGAAADAGTVLVAGVGSRLERRLPVDGVVPGGNRLLRSVQELQAEGKGVAVISSRARSALAAADVGIGLAGVARRPAWGAHFACSTLAEAHTLLAAVSAARRTSRQSALLAVIGSCMGLAFGTLGPALGAPSRASLPVNAAALFALGAGTWYGMQIATRAPPAAQPRTPWHAMPRKAVLRLLGSSGQGLSEAEARRRQPLEEEGRRTEGVARATLEGLVNPMTPLLGAGALISAAMGSVLDAGMIVFVLLASALVDGVQRATTSRELAHLLQARQLPSRLRRGDTTRTVPADQLVPGDVIELQAGDGIPADCRLLKARGLEVDESSLTGESQLVLKSTKVTTAPAIADRTSMLYHGTVVASGQATAVVVATGSHTELGRTTQEEGAAPTGAGGVEATLSGWTKRTLPLSAGAGVALLFVDMLRGSPLGTALSRAVGLAVAAVPEGLPFVATIAELAAARRLSKRGVLVRSPTTVEALGRVDALCFDKTGTLTQGRITLQQVSDGTVHQRVEELGPRLRSVIGVAIRATPVPEEGVPLPHLTDRAVLEGAARAGAGPDDSERLKELQFEPSRGYHATRTRTPDGARISVKGAPEAVLDRCSHRSVPDGRVPFDEGVRADIEAEIEQLALRGYRVLAVAERTAEESKALDDSDVCELDFAGLLALADPVHPTAAAAVGRLQRAGIDVIMITGDHPSTAEAIAAELGMLNGRRVVHGAELEEMADEDLASELPKIAVFARVSPAQKARIVRAFRRAERVVAMTGDGANDAPAIKLADVGIALGSRATPAAREAADLVIADDRIETITEAIVEGRGMWASVHDALAILLGGNLGEIAYALGAGLAGGSGALNARQLLVVNLLTDVLPALAIAVRPPPHATPDKLLAEGPESSLGTALTRDVYARAVATAGAAGAAWLLTVPVSTPGQARTTGLVALVSAQLGQTLAVRGRTPLVLAASLGSVVVLGAVVQTPGISQFFGNEPLLPHQWAVALGSATAATVAVSAWQAMARTGNELRT